MVREGTKLLGYIGEIYIFLLQFSVSGINHVNRSIEFFFKLIFSSSLSYELDDIKKKYGHRLRFPCRSDANPTFWQKKTIKIRDVVIFIT